MGGRRRHLRGDSGADEKLSASLWEHEYGILHGITGPISWENDEGKKLPTGAELGKVKESHVQRSGRVRAR